MELLLTLAVITAVIIFGAIISMGNERQRRAIDELREQVVLWAIQDLRIKREHMARDVRVDDPLEWLNRISTQACGYDFKLHVLEAFDTPRVLVCSTEDGENRRVIFTPHSPDEIYRIRKEKRSPLSRSTPQNLLRQISQRSASYEISALNNRAAFASESLLAWNSLTGQNVYQMERIWMYISQ